MKSKNTNRGITLIALIITIIVMLILVAVTISMAVNGGLFEYAGKAVGETQNALNVEQELSNGKIQVGGKWYASIDDYLEGKVLVELPEGLKVGDYVNYTPTTGTYKVASGANGSGYTSEQSFTTETGEAALKWRVLSIDEENGTVELVAATQSSTKLYLQGADGYNHAVDILNDLCKTVYSNTNGAEARSIKVEDINAKTTYDPTTDPSYSSKYGTEYKYSEYSTGNRKYPNLYAQEEGYYEGGVKKTGGIAGSIGKKDGVTDKESGVTTYSTVTGYTDDNDATATKDISVTYTYYYYNAESYLNTNLGVNTAPSGLIKTGTIYWLASRCVNARSGSANFSVRYLYSDGNVNGNDLFNSGGSTGYPSCAVRPVVSLGSNVTLTKDTTNSTDTTTYWNIEY